MHSNVKRFQVDGIINDDADFPRLRAHYEHLLVKEMRGNGYVPVLDLGPYFSTEYREDNKYNFVVTAYGIYVGRRKSWEIHGIVNGQMVLMTTQQKKLR
ncbi:hypothetical protein SEA_MULCHMANSION_74 [Streptomyces phage MulchMansion]|nr:hypothetical protein SEA_MULCHMANSION_74 [Streptomyces phage MulchMansion]